ncbi:MAG: CDP-alcohol phosphatidyltransferase family protein [Proteobacteria bacterium]|nr:CDP-alcohol phosphatidyltransferase family protein [Pseudomonadota bacterium]
MIKAAFGDRIDGWVQTLFPFLFSRSLDPNVLTVAGAVVCTAAAVAFAFGAFAAGALLLAAGGFFDLVDGVVARHRGVATPFGGFLDSTLDRLVDMVVLFGLVVHYAATGSVATVVLTGVVLVASVLTSYSKARAELVLGHFDGGFLERGERFGLLIAGGLFGIMVPVLWLLAVGTTFTAVQRFVLAHRLMAPLAESGERAPIHPVGEGESS